MREPASPLAVHVDRVLCGVAELVAARRPVLERYVREAVDAELIRLVDQLLTPSRISTGRSCAYVPTLLRLPNR